MLYILSSLSVVMNRPACISAYNLGNGVEQNKFCKKKHARFIDELLFQVLKVDRNQLEEIPSELALLTSLHTFCCDRQKPRLRNLPPFIGRLQQLQV